MTDKEIVSLHQEHGRELCTFALSIVGDFSAADDVLQEVFLALKIGNDVCPKEPKLYLYRAVRN